MGYAEKPHAAAVKGVGVGISHLFDVVGRKIAIRVQANLIQHAANMDDATNHIIGTAETRNVCHAEPYG
jgi:hypothetical protein